MFTNTQNVKKLVEDFKLRKFWENDISLEDAIREAKEEKKFPTDVGHFTMIDMTFKFRSRKIDFKENSNSSLRKLLVALRPNTYTAYSHCKFCYSEQMKYRRVNFQGSQMIYKPQNAHIYEDDMCIRCGLPLIEYVGFSDFRDRFCVICALMNKYHLRPHMRCLLHPSSQTQARGQTYVIFRNHYSLSSASKSKKKGTWRYQKIKLLLSPQVRRLNSVIRLEYLWIVQDLSQRQLFGKRVLLNSHSNLSVKNLINASIQKVRQRYLEIGPGMKFRHQKRGNEIIFESQLSQQELLRRKKRKSSGAEDMVVMISSDNEKLFYGCLRKLFQQLEKKLIGHYHISSVSLVLNSLPNFQFKLKLRYDSETRVGKPLTRKVDFVGTNAMIKNRSIVLPKRKMILPPPKIEEEEENEVIGKNLQKTEIPENEVNVSAMEVSPSEDLKKVVIEKELDLSIVGAKELSIPTQPQQPQQLEEQETVTGMKRKREETKNFVVSNNIVTQNVNNLVSIKPLIKVQYSAQQLSQLKHQEKERANKQQFEFQQQQVMVKMLKQNLIPPPQRIVAFAPPPQIIQYHQQIPQFYGNNQFHNNFYIQQPQLQQLQMYERQRFLDQQRMIQNQVNMYQPQMKRMKYFHGNQGGTVMNNNAKVFHLLNPIIDKNTNINTNINTNNNNNNNSQDGNGKLRSIGSLFGGGNY